MVKSLKPIIVLLLLSFCLWFLQPVIHVWAEPSSETVSESAEDEEEKTEEEDEESEEKEEPVKTETNDDGLTMPTLNSKSILLMDRDSGKILYSRNPDKKMEPASLTKIVTCLLAVEAIEAGTISEDEKLEASKHCLDGLNEESSSSGIVPGERLTVKDLLYCALLGSAGEACNVIAEALAGSISDFVDEMNERVLDLGCTGTHFVNSHGMPANDHYSTASDMMLISTEAMSHPLFAEICNTPSYTVPSTNKSDERVVYNSNALICSQGIYGGNFLYSNASGIKTGHTTAAGYCLSSTAEKDGVRLMCVVLGGGTSIRDDMATDFQNFSDTIHLYDWAFENYSYYTVLHSDDLVKEISLLYAPSDDSTVTLHPDKDVSVLLPSNVNPEDFEMRISLYEENPAAPVDADEAMGDITVTLNGVDYGKAKLLTTSSVDVSQSQILKAQLRKAFGHTWIWLLLLIILIFVLLYAFLVINYRRKRQRQLQRKRQQAQARVQQKTQQARSQMAPKTGKMRDYDSSGRPKDPNADKHDYFEEFFRNEEKMNKKHR